MYSDNGASQRPSGFGADRLYDLLPFIISSLLFTVVTVELFCCLAQPPGDGLVQKNGDVCLLDCFDTLCASGPLAASSQ